jgi:hypothetical protein
MNDKLLANYIRYCERELHEPLAMCLLEHTRDAMQATGTVPETLSQRIGEQVYMLMFTCVIEDFMTRPAAPDGVNTTDAFLKRNGWKMTPSARRSMHALRDSVMGFYKVVKVNPGDGIVLQDLLIDQPEIVVDHRGLSEVIPVGASIGARVLRSEFYANISEGFLPIDPDKSEPALQALRTAGGIGEAKITAKDLPALAPHISNVWLKLVLEDDTGEAE